MGCPALEVMRRRWRRDSRVGADRGRPGRAETPGARRISPAGREKAPRGGVRPPAGPDARAPTLLQLERGSFRARVRVDPTRSSRTSSARSMPVASLLRELRQPFGQSRRSDGRAREEPSVVSVPRLARGELRQDHRHPPLRGSRGGARRSRGDRHARCGCRDASLVRHGEHRLAEPVS